MTFLGVDACVPALTTWRQDCASHQHPGPLGRPRAYLHVAGHKLNVPEEYVHVCKGTSPSCWLVLNITGLSSYKLSHTNSQWCQKTSTDLEQASSDTHRKCFLQTSLPQ